MHKLTTGEMIAQLGLEDVAINQKGERVGYDHKGVLITWDEHEDKPGVTDGNQYIFNYAWVKGDTWEINHQFVEYDEAQEAHANEKKTVVYYHDDDLQYRFVYGEYGHFQKLASDGIGLHELVKGKWIIEN